MNGVSIASMGGISGVVEWGFGVLLVVGLFSRLSAFILSGLTAVAYFIAQMPQRFFPLLDGGNPAALYSFGILHLAAAGPGPWPVDAMRGQG
ncbi:DoxX family protein [Sulfitobacter sp. 1A12157]